MQKIFDNYLKKFDMQNEKIKVKYHHSIRVMALCEIIAKSLNLSKREVYLASVTGLFHDIARFKQARDYDTFVDADSFDHGDEGYTIFLKDIIPSFDLTSDEIKMVSKAIKYHNKYSVPKVTGLMETLCKIVRDADKIDILYQYMQKKITFEVPTSSVEDIFFNHQQITNGITLNNGDNVLKVLAMMYDINFESSFKIIKDNKYLDMIEKNLGENVKKYILEIKKYMEDFDGNKI